MPTTTLTINSELLSSTLYAAAKEVVDQLDYTKPLMMSLEEAHGKGKPSIEGGTQIHKPLNFSEHSETTQLTTGYEPINLAITEVGTPAIDTWADFIRPVVISGHEKRINRGSQHKLYDIAAERGKATMAAFRRQWETRAMGMQNTGMTDMNTINGLDFTDGFIEEVAVGSQTNTVHGVNKTTYQTQVGWQNQRADAAGSFSANGLISLDQVMIECRSIKDSPRNMANWLASRSGYGHLKRAVRTNERYVTQETVDGGRLTLQWDGYDVHIQRNMPNAGGTSTNDPMSFLFLNYGDINFITNGGDYFRTGEFVEQSGYDVLAAPIHLMGQLFATFLGGSGLIFDAESW